VSVVKQTGEEANKTAEVTPSNKVTTVEIGECSTTERLKNPIVFGWRFGPTENVMVVLTVTEAPSIPASETVIKNWNVVGTGEE
jgi:hypothetical protein